jgi:hypothetical protein
MAIIYLIQMKAKKKMMINMICGASSPGGGYELGTLLDGNTLQDGDRTTLRGSVSLLPVSAGFCLNLHFDAKDEPLGSSETSYLLRTVRRTTQKTVIFICIPEVAIRTGTTNTRLVHVQILVSPVS